MQIAIRCHPYAPVASDELEEWLAREVDRIRAAAPDASVLQLDAILRDMRLLGLQPTLLGLNRAGSPEPGETEGAHAH